MSSWDIAWGYVIGKLIWEGIGLSLIVGLLIVLGLTVALMDGLEKWTRRHRATMKANPSSHKNQNPQGVDAVVAMLGEYAALDFAEAVRQEALYQLAARSEDYQRVRTLVTGKSVASAKKARRRGRRMRGEG